MTPSEADAIRTRLKSELAASPQAKGVRFGEVAYFVFLHSRWIEWREEVGVLAPHLKYEVTYFEGVRAICDPSEDDNFAELVQ